MLNELNGISNENGSPSANVLALVWWATNEHLSIHPTIRLPSHCPGLHVLPPSPHTPTPYSLNHIAKLFGIIWRRNSQLQIYQIPHQIDSITILVSRAAQCSNGPSDRIFHALSAMHNDWMILMGIITTEPCKLHSKWIELSRIFRIKNDIIALNRYITCTFDVGEGYSIQMWHHQTIPFSAGQWLGAAFDRSVNTSVLESTGSSLLISSLLIRCHQHYWPISTNHNIPAPTPIHCREILMHNNNSADFALFWEGWVGELWVSYLFLSAPTSVTFVHADGSSARDPPPLYMKNDLEFHFRYHGNWC